MSLLDGPAPHASTQRSDTVRRAAFGLISAGYLALAVSAAMNPLLVPVAALLVASAYRLRVAGDAAAAVRQASLRRVALGGLVLWATLAIIEWSTLSLVAASAIWGGFWLLFQPESERNYYVSFLVALAQLVVSGGTTDSAVFALSILLFIVSGTLALASMTLRGDRGGLSGRLGERPGAGLPGHPVPVIQNGAWEAEAEILVRLATIVTGVIIASTIVLFFVIPRYGAGYFFSKDQTGERRAAFSDTVDFGAVGAVQQGGAIAMRVELLGHKGPYAGILRWRGVGLGQFDGRRWTAGEGRSVTLQNVTKGFRESSNLVHAPFSQGGRRIEQKIFLSQDTGLLFGATRIHRIWGKFTRLTKTNEESLLVQFPAYTARDYRCISDVGRPPPALLREMHGFTYPNGIRKAYLQLPADMDPRVAQLARSIVGDAKTDYDRAVRIESYLRTQLKYELPGGQVEAPRRPVEQFLFETKRGHCEHFASSFAVLARTLGVPARVVNGYAGGTYNEVGGYYLISDADAHSWVEVFFPGEGWVDFDPTPQDALGHDAQSLRSQIFMYWDAALMAWRRYVVDYHLLDQVEYVRSLGRWFRGESNEPAALAQAPGGRSLPPVVSFVLLTIAVLAVLMRVLGTRASTRPQKRELGAAAFYVRMLDVLASRGVLQNPALAPAERAAAVARAWPAAASAVNGITAVYVRLRFGGHPADADRARIEAWMAELAAMPRPSVTAK